MRSPRTWAALALVALPGVIGAGCGSSAPSGGRTADQAKAVKFAACVRDHGVPDFPDPDASGELTLDGVANGSSLDPDRPAFRTAVSACQSLEPSGFTGHRRSAGQQQTALEFARCIRENGVKDFPDPVNGEPLVDTRRIPSTDAPGGMSVLNAAMQKCHDVVAGLLGGQR